jgi:hypothetical protein
MPQACGVPAHNCFGIQETVMIARLAGFTHLLCLAMSIVLGTAFDTRADLVSDRNRFRLLEQRSETRIGRIGTFVAAEAFKEGSRIGDRTLSAVGWNFLDHFSKVVEENVPEVTLKGWTLRYTGYDESHIKALGGSEKAAVPLAHIHRLMELGELGPSHLDWQSNFAYVRSPIDHKLWAVHWYVNDANEWVIGAVVIPHPEIDWRPNSRLFGGSVSSPNSVDLRKMP